ncbi:hypothetical protein WJX74_010562 [Apatococcus lobatus]|uniref:Amine oxidase n=1 Tax=Apatococcus lobatus TaxID=904363 RepID=A0AAW1QM57_9CHLO
MPATRQGSHWASGAQVHGNDIDYQKWHIRIGFNYREGLVLHNVGYRDGDRIRPILHRASLVQMAVPYADTKQPYVRKCAFDVGDYGLGNCSNSLALGCDWLGHIHYSDAILNNSRDKSLGHPPPGPLIRVHRRQLRIRLLLILLPGRQHPV